MSCSASRSASPRSATCWAARAAGPGAAAPSAPDPVPPSTPRHPAEPLRRNAPTVRQVAPDVDEARRPDEAPPALAARLAEAKARAVAQRHPGAVVIGSDQVAALGDRV